MVYKFPLEDLGDRLQGTATGTNTGDETAARIGALIGGAADATPNDTDYVATSLTGGGILKKITWSNVKAFLKTYFDNYYHKKLTIAVMSISAAVTSGGTVFFGNKGLAPTAEGRSKIYVEAGTTIIGAEINSWAGTNGSNETISMYLRKDGATDTLIASVSMAAMDKQYSNNSLDIYFASRGFFEIKVIYPSWATPPGNTAYGGYITLK